MSSKAKEASPLNPNDYRIAGKSAWAGAWKVAAVSGALGLALSGYGYKVDPTRFAFSYLFGFFVALSLAVGSLFFVLVLYITKASWGITVRRVAELCMQPIWIFALLVIPLTQSLAVLFPWNGANHAAVEASKGAPGENGPSAAHEKSPIEEARGIAGHEPAALRDIPVANAKRMEKAEEGAEQKIVDHK